MNLSDDRIDYAWRSHALYVWVTSHRSRHARGVCLKKRRTHPWFEASAQKSGESSGPRDPVGAAAHLWALHPRLRAPAQPPERRTINLYLTTAARVTTKSRLSPNHCYKQIIYMKHWPQKSIKIVYEYHFLIENHKSCILFFTIFFFLEK